MLSDFIVERCETTGTSSPYSLSLGVPGNSTYQRWSDGDFTSGDVVFYVARSQPNSPGGMKYEEGWGILTTGTSWTITRNVLKSSNSNAAVDWQLQDLYVVYSAPVGVALGKLLTGNIATSKPAWAQMGFEWLDKSAGVSTRWLRKIFNGTTDVETGRYHAANGVYTAAMSMDVVDNGAAGLTIADVHRDKFIDFNVTAASRTCTLGAVSTYAKGFAFGVYGYGSTSNNIALTPDAAEKINEGAAGAALNIAGGSPKIVRADHVRSAWLVHG